MTLKTINTDKAPAAIGPYSQAIGAGNLLFTSGQIPIDPATGEVVQGGIREQTEMVLKNLGEVLKAGGASFDSVAKTTCFLNDMADFADFNAVYAEYFKNKPARSTVAAKALPKGVLCEVEAVAIVG